jgi:hypothetical protein
LVETWPGIPMWDDLVKRGLIIEDESWEHTTRVIDLTHTQKEREFILTAITQAYKDHISYKNMKWIFKTLLDIPFSSYKRKIARDFMENLESGLKTFVRLRNLRLTGFGKFSTS